ELSWPYGTPFWWACDTKRYRTVHGELDTDVYAVLCATVVTGGIGRSIGGRRRTRALPRSARRPQPGRRDQRGDRIARRGRTVGGDHRRHRRPLGCRQVDDLSALGLARRRAARR